MLAEILHNLDSAKKSLDVISLKINKIIFVIDVTLNTIFCNLNLQSYAFFELCITPFDCLEIDVHTLSYEQAKTHKAVRRDKTELSHSLEQFIWISSLLVAQGRLPINTDLSVTISVKNDALISKLEQIPYLEEIIAELNINPCSLMEVSTRLNIPYRYAVSFYNAALNLDLLEFNVNKKVVTKKTFAGIFSK